MTQGYLLSTLLVLISFFTMSCENIVVDEAMGAVEGNDVTVLLEGCGNQLVVGYTFCRMAEGDASNKNLTIVGPATNCERDACVFYTFYNNNGEPILGGQLTKDSTRKLVPWKDILKRSTFEISDRGFWGVKLEIFWLDPDGRERKTEAQGEIRLRVLKKEYKPLHEIADDPNFTWQYTESGVTAKMTSGARAYVSKKGN